MINDAVGKPIALGQTVFRVTPGRTGATGSWVRSKVVMGDMVVGSLHLDKTISVAGDTTSRIPTKELYTDLRDAVLAFKAAYEDGLTPRVNATA